MANTIAQANKFLPLLDEVYKTTSKTAIMDSTTQNVSFLNANEVKIYKMTMTGLATYSRSAGFVAGAVVGSWETWTLARDRGITFSIDAMDNDETFGLSFGKLASEFVRTKVVPEVDAYRFAKYSATSGVSKATADLASTTIVAAVDTAQSTMDEDEVPEENRKLFITPSNYAKLKQSGAATRFATMSDSVLNREFEVFDTMEVIKVPQTRFYTIIDLSATDGFSKNASAEDINFMIIHPSAVEQVTKHAVLRIFEPAVNQSMDAYKVDYRIYHDCFVYENKVAGIYVHTASTSASL